MVCIIKDDAYVSSNTVTVLQKERFVLLSFFGLTTILSFERIPVLDSSRKRGISLCFHLPELLLNLTGRYRMAIDEIINYIEIYKEYCCNVCN